MLRALAILIICAYLVSCGQTGPLYHPDEEPPIHVPDTD